MKNFAKNMYVYQGCKHLIVFDKFLFLQKIDRFSCYKYLVINIENGLLKVGTLFYCFLFLTQLLYHY